MMRKQPFANKKYRTQSGFTLIEMVIVVVLVGLMASTVSVLMTHAIQMAQTQYAVNHNNEKTAFAMTRMRRDLYHVRGGRLGGLLLIAPSRLRFMNSAGETIFYQLSSGVLRRNGKLLADNIRVLTFRYYNAQGNMTNQASAVRYVNIAMTAVEKSARLTVSTTVFLRNIPNADQEANVSRK